MSENQSFNMYTCIRICENYIAWSRIIPILLLLSAFSLNRYIYIGTQNFFFNSSKSGHRFFSNKLFLFSIGNRYNNGIILFTCTNVQFKKMYCVCLIIIN